MRRISPSRKLDSNNDWDWLAVRGLICLGLEYTRKENNRKVSSMKNIPWNAALFKWLDLNTLVGVIKEYELAHELSRNIWHIDGRASIAEAF